MAATPTRSDVSGTFRCSPRMAGRSPTATTTAGSIPPTFAAAAGTGSGPVLGKPRRVIGNRSHAEGAQRGERLPQSDAALVLLHHLRKPGEQLAEALQVLGAQCRCPLASTLVRGRTSLAIRDFAASLK